MAKPKIVFLDAFTNNPGDLSFDAFLPLGDFTVYDRTTFDQLSTRVQDAEIIIVNKFPINNETIVHMPKVKFIAVAATGYNNIDIGIVKEHKIAVSNVGGYSKNSVAQHVFASILSYLNRSSYYQKEVKHGRWCKVSDFCFYDHTITELAGKTMGIIGFGTIGQQVASIAHAFGMRVVVSVRNPLLSTPDYISVVNQDTLFGNSDFLTLHCPLNDDSYQIINKSNLQKMKSSSVLINTGRGGLINEGELSSALHDGIISAALLDVLDSEPPLANNILLQNPKCMITPHIAWASLESRQKLLDGVVQNIESWLRGRWINQIY